MSGLNAIKAPNTRIS